MHSAAPYEGSKARIYIFFWWKSSPQVAAVVISTLKPKEWMFKLCSIQIKILPGNPPSSGSKIERRKTLLPNNLQSPPNAHTHRVSILRQEPHALSKHQEAHFPPHWVFCKQNGSPFTQKSLRPNRLRAHNHYRHEKKKISHQAMHFHLRQVVERNRRNQSIVS